ncbi:hypothetical protein UPYG_G00147070 [Umbra pygmaea]|uniref:Protein kinase domain-containing protein n=1 Tax=Umbra pygmaea TaxID=75934 RepID=A0ABD0WWH2_UMBPY
MAYSTSTIAAGCFGKIYKEQYNGTWAAIKKVPQHFIRRHDLERECEIYKKSVHPNIVKLLKNPTLENSKWIITMEFIFGEDLETAIFKSQKSKIQLNPSVKATIITGMCEGLFHLHSKEIVHQDLKPDNIMVEHDTYRAVIIDMGLAKFNRNGLSSAADMGNEAYSPPEVLQRIGHRNQGSDVWAMGKIIAELCARVRLHTPSVCPEKIKETLRHQGQQYCNIVCKMVQTDPRQRATMAEVMPEIRRTGANDSNPKVQQRVDIQTPSPIIEVKDKLPHARAPVQRVRRPEVKTLRRAPVRPPSTSIWERGALAPNPEFKITPIPEDPVHSSPPPPGPVPHVAAKDIFPQPQAPVQNGRRWELAATPKPEVKKSQTPPPKVDHGKAVVPVAEPIEDAMKKLLYIEATKGLPCPLPQTGNVRIHRK